MTTPLTFGGLFGPQEEDEDDRPLALIPGPDETFDLIKSFAEESAISGSALEDDQFPSSGEDLLSQVNQFESESAAKIKNEKFKADAPPAAPEISQDDSLNLISSYAESAQRSTQMFEQPAEEIIPKGIVLDAGSQELAGMAREAAGEEMEEGWSFMGTLSELLPEGLQDTLGKGGGLAGPGRVIHDLLSAATNKTSIEEAADTSRGSIGTGEFTAAAFYDANVRLMRGALEVLHISSPGAAQRMRKSYEVLKTDFLDPENAVTGVREEAGMGKKITANALIAISNLVPVMPSVQVGALSAKLAARAGIGVAGKRGLAVLGGAAANLPISVAEAQGFPEEDRAQIIGSGAALGGLLGGGASVAGDLVRGLTGRKNQEIARLLNVDVDQQLPVHGEVLIGEFNKAAGEIDESNLGATVRWALNMREQIGEKIFTERRGVDTLTKGLYKTAKNIEKAMGKGEITSRDFRAVTHVTGTMNIGAQKTAKTRVTNARQALKDAGAWEHLEVRDQPNRKFVPLRDEYNAAQQALREVQSAGVNVSTESAKFMHPSLLRKMADDLAETTTQLDRNGKLSGVGISTPPQLIDAVTKQWKQGLIPIHHPVTGMVSGFRKVKSMDEITNRPEIKAYGDLFLKDLSYYMAYRRQIGKWNLNQVKPKDQQLKLDGQTYVDALKFQEAIQKKYPPNADGVSLLDEVTSELRDVSHLQLLNLRNAGMISEKQMNNMLDEGADYIPFQRVRSVLEGNSTKGSLRPPKDTPIGRLPEGMSRDNPIANPVSELFMQSSSITQMANRQIARSTLIDLLEKDLQLEDKFRMFPTSLKLRKDAEGGLADLSKKGVKAIDRKNDQLLTKLRKDKVHFETLKRSAGDAAREGYEAKIFKLTEEIETAEANGMLFFERLQLDEDGALKVFRTDKATGEVKQQVYDAPDELLRALDAIPPRYINGLERAAAGATRILRAGSLATNQFVLKNLARDQVLAGIASKNGFIPAWSSVVTLLQDVAVKIGIAPEAWAKRVADFERSGVMQATLINASSSGVVSERALRRQIERNIQRPTQGIKKTIQKARSKKLTERMEAWEAGRASLGTIAGSPIRAMEGISNAAEGLTRKAEFRLARESHRIVHTPNAANGNRWTSMRGPKTLRQAGNEAADITLNFARGGRYGKMMNRAEPFFNAKLQDMSKFARLLEDRETRFTSIAKAFAYITLPTLANQVAWKDDPEYWKLPEHEKANFLHMFKDGNGTFRKMPRAQGSLNLIFGYFSEMLMAPLIHDENTTADDLLAGDLTATSDPRAGAIARHRLGQKAMEELPPLAAVSGLSPIPGVGLLLDKVGLNDGGRAFVETALPQIAQPLFEAAMNQDVFRGQAIEGRSQQGLPRMMRKSSSTTGIATGLAGLVPKNMISDSPIKMQHLMDGYLGTNGRDFARLLSGDIHSEDPRSRGAKLLSDDLVPGGKNIPFVGSFRSAFTTTPQKDEQGRDVFGMGSQNVTDLFELRDSANEALGAIKELDQKGRWAEALQLELYQPEAFWAEDINQASRDISALSQERREVLNDPFMDEDTKFELLLQIEREISFEAQFAVEFYLGQMLQKRLQLEVESEENGTEDESKFSAEAPFFDEQGEFD